MRFALTLHEVDKAHRLLVGGKAFALARMARNGISVPPAVCVSTEAYDQFVDSSHLRGKILMEFHRKPFEQMRWEEMWDVALRIQNLFINSEIPTAIASSLANVMRKSFGDKAVVVRSSAVGEDSVKTSFAGIHESYVNVKGTEEILEHIKLVWASLWSDAAMLYRREIGLDITNSRMGVVVQELVQGEKSGIIFGRSPSDNTTATLEAVYGLNQGLVDGTIEPDRWVISRRNGIVVSFEPAKRLKAIMSAPQGVEMIELSKQKKRRPPLNKAEVKVVFDLEKRLEKLFMHPQDVEWTYKGRSLFSLQSRPITSGTGSTKQDDRRWYLSLKRSFDNVKVLRQTLELEIIPAMIHQSQEFGSVDLTELCDEDLAREIELRKGALDKWKKAYWDFCIPFAHGFRLFGQVYNSVVKPDDPFEFVELLRSDSLKSVQRNEELQHLAGMLQRKPQLQTMIKEGKRTADREFEESLESFLNDSASPILSSYSGPEKRRLVGKLLLEMTQAKSSTIQKARSPKDRENIYLNRFPDEKRRFGLELLDLARASYRLRDDDNIFLGRIETQLVRALHEAEERSNRIARLEFTTDEAAEVTRMLRDETYSPRVRSRPEAKTSHYEKVRARQLVGQPAGSGVAIGKARVVKEAKDVFDFKKGEVLVCDAIDPNMTFVVPLAAGVVERRGGMLIHGAIIAREYCLPCITGVPDAVQLIKTGDNLTVDGYLGIVTVSRGRVS
jgi:pyruvate,water dikinase